MKSPTPRGSPDAWPEIALCIRSRKRPSIRDARSRLFAKATLCCSEISVRTSSALTRSAATPESLANASFQTDPQQLLGFDRKLHRQLAEDVLAEAGDDHVHRV